MGTQIQHISQSVEVLHNSLSEIGRVVEWAERMGYNNPRRFSRRFLHYYEERPCKTLAVVRLVSIFKKLQNGNHSNFRIARLHSLPDEKALNKFVNYHLNCCPSELGTMHEKDFYSRLNKLGFDAKW